MLKNTDIIVVGNGRKMTFEEYKRWMYNPENIYQCNGCPENCEREGHRWPCGQQNCWVAVHCE